MALGAGLVLLLVGGGQRVELLGAASKKLDTTPPSVAITFPVKKGVYGPATWAGCAPAGICGTASDATGVTSVEVAVQRGTGSYWNGTSFIASTTPVYHLADGTTAWSLAMSLPPDGAYTVSVRAADPAANRSNPISLSFQVDSTAVDNKVFGIADAVGSRFPRQVLHPGGSSPLDLQLTNPYNFTIRVTGITAVATDAVKSSHQSPLCSVDTDVITTGLITRTPMTAPTVDIRANDSKTLSSYLALGDTWPADWPTITMPNTNANQDDCKNTTFTLSYTGTATKP
jgi:hypothetical protein